MHTPVASFASRAGIRLCSSLLVALLFFPLAVRAQAPAGALRGVVINESTGGFVEGAEITLPGTPPRTTVSDSQGAFFIGGVPAGAHRLRVESAGTQPFELAIEIEPGATRSVTVRLASDVVSLQPLLVTAQAEGQAQSLNLQRNAEDIRNVVSEDALANSRLGEVGEVLQSISGIYLEASTHQPARPNIRGLSAEFNAVTYDGVAINNWQGTRDAQVGSFPAENLARVEVMKSLTPDQEGNAIGGKINLVSKRAFDLSARQLKLGVGTTYNHQLENFDRQANIDYGDKFGAEGRLGVFSSLNYYRTDRAYHNLANTYQVSAADVFNVATQTILDRIEKGSWKLKYTGSVDYRLSERTVMSLRGIYSNDRRYLADYRTIYRPGTRTNITPDSANSTNGRIDVDRQYREPETINYQVSLAVEQNLDLWKLDYDGGFNRISNTYSETFYPTFSFNGVNMSYDRSVRDFPVFTITNNVDLTDPSRLSHREIARTQFNSRHIGHHLSFNARRDLVELPFKAYVKTGVRAKLSDFRQDIGNQGWWNYTGPLTAAQMSTVYVNDRFMRESDGRARPATLFPDIDTFLDAFHHRPQEFTRQDNRSDIRLAQEDVKFYEDIYATYLMGSAHFGRAHVVTGARFERTEFVGFSNELDTPRGILTGVKRIRTKTTSDNVLPSLNVIYAFRPDLQLRAAVTKSLARPSQLDLLPVRTVDDTTMRVSDGNPGLGVTESTNYDVSIEYYLKPLGVVSVGAFQKEIDGFYFNRTETVQSGEFAGYELTRPSLGDGGRVRGVELELQKRLTFLPGWLSGFGVGTNYTFIDTEGRYPNRSDELPLVGAAERIGNVNVFYARGPIDLRAFLNYRGPYIDALGSRPALDVYEDDRTTLSFFAKYKLNRRTTLNLDVNNITDSPKRQYQGDSSNPRSVRYYDWAVNLRAVFSL